MRTTSLVSSGGPGALLATLLEGAWRSSSSIPEELAEELPRLKSLLLESGLAALTWWHVRNWTSLDRRVGEELRQAYLYSTIQAEVCEHEIKRVFTALRSAGVEPILIKGWAAARLYPEVGLRPCGDIDLCVHPAQYATAEAALDEFTDRRFAFDLHDGLADLKERRADDLFSGSELVKLGEVNVRVLGAEDHLRLLCIHFLRHGAYRPLWLCDIAAAVELRPASFDWERCLGAERRRREWIECVVSLAHQLLGARIDGTPAVQSSRRLPRWLIRSVLNQWENPNTMHHGVMKHRAEMASYGRDLRGVLKDIRNRWPNAIEATVNVGGPFNDLPRLPFQIGECVRRTMRFVGG